MHKTLFATAALSFGLFAASATLANERTMIVLDGSGSMWGQIDGVPKLQIARDTLRDVLKSVPETTELGLMAYGHRKKGDCSDIELVVPPALGTASTIVEKADKMKFLGKTPLTDAVKKAAEELRYTEDAATVVLITDGLETCEANVCELGKLLAEQGQGFTAHVVGFGLTKEEGKQVACLAENTGGQYFSASDGEGLVKALQQTVVAVVPTVTLTPINQDGNEVKDMPMSWSVSDASNALIDSRNSEGKISTKLDEGSYSVSITGPEVSGGGTFDVVADQRQQTFEIPVEISRLEATVSAPQQVAAGAPFEATWEGPDQQSDYITIVEIGAEEGSYNDYAYTKNGNPAELRAPDGLGTYEVRYVHGETERTLGSAEIEVTAISGSVAAPEQVAAGANFKVDWTGPGYQSDYITIVDVGAEEGSYKSYAYARKDNTVEIQAPDGLGTYEVRYVIGASKRTLASTTIEVTEISAALDAPAAVPAGSEIKVDWTGPDNERDYITIVEVGAEDGSYKSYAYTQNGNPAKITAPDEVGAYELRYVVGSSERTLASKPIEVTEVSATLVAPDNAPAGSEVTVEWVGPNNERDYITIVPVGAEEGAYLDYKYTANENPAKVLAPDATGPHEIRYVKGGSQGTLASRPIDLTPISASLEVLSELKAGQTVEVKWEGPNNERDYITVVEVGASEGSYQDYAYTDNGNPARFNLPATAGEYELRYVLGTSSRTLASLKITVE